MEFMFGDAMAVVWLRREAGPERHQRGVKAGEEAKESRERSRTAARGKGETVQMSLSGSGRIWSIFSSARVVGWAAIDSQLRRGESQRALRDALAGERRRLSLKPLS